MADEPATPAAEELKIRVKSASVEVFITLNAKFLAQPLEKALINPFIKVYNKKTDVPVSLESLISIHVTGAACPDGPVTIDTAKDPTVAASTILGSKEGVHIEFTFAEQQMMPVFTEGMSEVEKLKARRRAENAAKRAAAGTTDDAAAASDPSADTPPVPPPAAPVESGPLGQLSKAEAQAQAIETELKACTTELAAATSMASVDAISTRATAAAGGVGKLMAMMDEIDLGDLDEEPRAAARVRRKAINAKVEDVLEPAKKDLNKAVMAARKRLG
jgi:hypothetical protein